MSNPETLETLLPTQPFDLESGLSLTPRLKLNLTVHRADKSVAPIDEWKLKSSLIDYFKSSHSVSVPQEDINVFKYKDLKKRKREDPVARGSLFLRDLGFLSKRLMLNGEDGVEREFSEWRKGIVKEMDGMELNLEGVKFKLSVELPNGDDFEGMKKEWEEMAAFGTRGYSRGNRQQQQPDTIILRGVPSRWFAEPRVSSKPSMLVSHTIFSAFGKIRNLDVGEDNDIGENEDGDDLVSGLNCKIVVRFDGHKDFCNALKVLCGRSLHKEGSRLRADYEVTWDRDGYFRNGRTQLQQSKGRTAASTGEGNYRSEVSGRLSRYSPDDVRRKRFKD